MTGADIRQTLLNDVTNFGVRITVGVIFIVHGYSKIGNEGFLGWLPSLGVPPEMGIIIILAEIIPGILLIVGVLTRISASVISMIMVAAIFHIKGAASLTGDKGYEFDLILLAAAVLIITMGPGRISLAHIIKKIPRPIH